ncbi:hypothetical protein HFP89_15645 [Wenzhouxiangella sp. XN79A]|uniref:hypothetical protein n=1 Tax=Wenzhouxiangella sp. XN79A TaxID=2724193 RepID=UPI00144A795A|nr:hypothetical protein [Wenzhouxiangella sp. XN79A]NKI36605.1 hypothetical protein [Wenzhouxiangella sp. XN79A]
MNRTSPRTPVRKRRLAASIGLALTALTAPALAVEVTGSFSGWWDQPSQQNHGMIVTIAGALTGVKTGAIYWAIYDTEGNPTWLFAQGDILGDTIDARVYEVTGVNFGDPAGTNPDPVNEIGTMQVRFTNCTTGQVDYDVNGTGTNSKVIVGTGGFTIKRITNQPGAPCSGGIGDDVPRGTVPETFDIALVPTGVIPGASGDADFELRPGEVEFDVEIEDLPVGSYELRIGGVTRGTIEVVDTASGPEGELEFGSPPDADELLLDFDPRGQDIDVLDNGVIILTNVAPDVGDPPGTGTGGTPPAFGNSEISIDLANLGVYPGGEAEADFDQESDEVEFDVEVEDVPVGSYTLFVGGIERGTIQVVVQDDGDTEGEIEFRYPVEAGKLPLDFDPRGETVEIAEGATTLFSSVFPIDGPPDDDDDDDGGDGGDGGIESEIREDLTNTGVYPAGSGEARWEEDDGEIDFDVEIEDVPVGGYTLRVGGVERGTIQVSDTGDGIEGEIEFGDPVDEVGELPLDFDPRGQLIEVLEGETVIFTLDFPGS